MEPKPGNRRERRNAATELAKEILRGHEMSERGISRGDWALFLLAGAIAIALFIIEKTPQTVALLLVFMAAFLVHPALNLPWVVKAQTKTGRIFRSVLSLAFALGIIVALGITQWPKSTTRHLGTNDLYTLHELLATETGQLQISAIVNDGESEALAEQLMGAFLFAGWDVRPKYVLGYLFAGPASPIAIRYTNADDKKHELIERALKQVHLECDSRLQPNGGTAPPITIVVGHFARQQ
jgi:hypothetical protein